MLAATAYFQVRQVRLKTVHKTLAGIAGEGFVQIGIY